MRFTYSILILSIMALVLAECPPDCETGQDFEIDANTPVGTTFDVSSHLINTPSGGEINGQSGSGTRQSGSIRLDINGNIDTGTGIVADGEIEATLNDDGSLSFDSIGHFRTDHLDVQGAEDGEVGEGSSNFARALEVKFFNTGFTNVQGFKQSGNDIFVSHGDLVIEGTDIYFNVKDSLFHFENGKIKSVDITSAKNDNSFIIKGTSIVVDENRGFKIDYYDKYMTAYIKDETLFRNIPFEQVTAYASTIINFSYMSAINYISLSTGSSYILKSGLKIINPSGAPYHLLMSYDGSNCTGCIDYANKRIVLSGDYLVMIEDDLILNSTEGNATMQMDYEMSGIISLDCAEGVHAFTGVFEARCGSPISFRFADKRPYYIQKIEPNTDIREGILTSGTLSMYEYQSIPYYNILLEYYKYVARGHR